MHNHQAILTTPFAMLGIRCNTHALLGLAFLPKETPAQQATNALAARVCEQLLAYLRDPTLTFDIPLELHGTEHQRKVWQALRAIPPGETRQYGQLAKQLGSASQAVGQACGANPIALIVPCHRVVSKTGMGGFMRHAEGETIDIKRWLLAHECAYNHHDQPLWP